MTRCGSERLLLLLLKPKRSSVEREIRSLDPAFGLDEAALSAARQWRFPPGTRFGEPVAVLVTIVLEFRLL